MSMSKRGRKKEKIGSGVLVSGVVICIAAAIIGSLAIPGLAAQQTGDTVNVTVNAPAYVEEEETFGVTIDVDNITDLNSAQFELSFDPTVIELSDVKEGKINGDTVPIFMWNFVDADTVGVLVNMPMGQGVSGSGYLAKISFKVEGEQGDRSDLDISDGLLVDKEAEEILAEWIDGEVIVGPVQVKVTAPEKVKAGGTFNATINVDNLMDFNSGQFDLSFDSSIVNVTGVANGSLDCETATIPVGMWDLVDADTVKVLVNLPMGQGVSGSGYLARISFEVVGEQGDRSELDMSKGLLVDKEAAEIPTEWIDDEVMVEIEHPFVTIKTDKSVYMCGENQTRTLTIENPTSESVQVKLGMGFHIYEIMDYPCSYDVDLFETTLLLPANHSQNFDSIAALDLPDGKYAWPAYLKDATGVKISESEAKFSIVALAPSLSTSTIPSEGMSKELTVNVKQGVNAELS